MSKHNRIEEALARLDAEDLNVKTYKGKEYDLIRSMLQESGTEMISHNYKMEPFTDDELKAVKRLVVQLKYTIDLIGYRDIQYEAFQALCSFVELLAGLLEVRRGMELAEVEGVESTGIGEALNLVSEMNRYAGIIYKISGMDLPQEKD